MRSLGRRSAPGLIAVLLLPWAGAVGGQASSTADIPPEAVGEPPTAEAPVYRNRIHLELFGNAGLAAVNYERLVRPETAVRIGFGLGWYAENCKEIPDIFFGTSLVCDDDLSAVVLGAMLVRVHGSRPHKLELGSGVTVGSVRGEYQREPIEPGMLLSATAAVGYRYQGRRMVYRLVYTPSYGLGSNAPPYRGFYGTAGLSAGIAF
jgi:hypothetical protein